MMYDFEDLVKGLLLLWHEGLMTKQLMISIIEDRLKKDITDKL